MHDLENASNFIGIKIPANNKGNIQDALWNLNNNGYSYNWLIYNDGRGLLFVWNEEADYAMTVLDDYKVKYELITDF